MNNHGNRHTPRLGNNKKGPGRKPQAPKPKQKRSWVPYATLTTRA